MRLNALPILREDETLYSLVARIRLANAAKDDRDACRSMFGHSKNTRVSDYPVNLIHFCDMTNGCFGDPLSILATMTLVKFFEEIGGHPWHAGSSVRPIEIAGYGLSTLSNGNIQTWKFCKDCMTSDLSIFSIAYWRRSHQLPTSFFCQIHGTVLSRSLVHPYTRHNRFMFPDDEVASSEQYCTATTSGNEDILWRLTQLGIAILHQRQSSLSSSSTLPEISHSAILRAIKERGLFTQNGSLRLKDFSTELMNKYHFLRPHPEFSNALSEKSIDILGRNLRSAGKWRSVAHRLLLIDWLFGSWVSFHQQCKWQHVMDQSFHTAPAKVRSKEIFDENSNFRSQQHLHRAACINFLTSNKIAKRSIFARAASHSFRWLLRYDKQWLDQHFPVCRRKHLQKEMF
ncbi:TniQ family protein [Undibacterium sp. CY21W]|uniref:TniQ family protein n=1 Tax=Undibacterium sp. CY21W TaxID=2762293 RepID=UPI00164C4B1A|nr:TniQ family protein [Undibacterium sp. CY21W]MBC3927329.1 TniQ family protein [Undibacterium sp. CY21W]